MFDNFFPENLAFYKLIKKNMIKPDRPQMTQMTAHSHCELDN